MKLNTKIFPALIIGVSIIVLGLCLSTSVKTVKGKGVVSVKGLCEKEVKANKVTWPLVTKATGNSLAEIYDTTQKNNKIITDFLKQNGITDSEIVVNPVSVTDELVDSYGSNQKPYRYSSTSVIVVTSTQVDNVLSLITKQSELLKSGIALIANDWQYPTRYEYTDLNSVKPEMIAEATKNAREAAEKFAQDSESHLGSIANATQGQFSIEDRDEYTPTIKTIRVVTSVTFNLED